DAATETQRALAHLEEVITFEGPKNIAALLIEPVVGSNGVVIYPDGYLQGLRDITAKHGIVLVFDEVMTGFGRLGDIFAAQKFDVAPDMITFAKGVASAFVPLGGVLVREDLASHFDDNALMCGHTYSGHPLAMAAGLATVTTMRKEGLFQPAREIEPQLRAGFQTIMANHPVVGDARVIGAFSAIEFVKDR